MLFKDTGHVVVHAFAKDFFGFVEGILMLDRLGGLPEEVLGSLISLLAFSRARNGLLKESKTNVERKK